MADPHQYYLAGYLVDLTWLPEECSEQGFFVASIDGLPEARAHGETKAEALAALAEILKERDYSN